MEGVVIGVGAAGAAAAAGVWPAGAGVVAWPDELVLVPLSCAQAQAENISADASSNLVRSILGEIFSSSG
jgi:hypothetical protein